MASKRTRSRSTLGHRCIGRRQPFDRPGEIHGLVGENGSGKSTFIRILSGYHIPEPGGVVLVDEAQVRLGSPASSYEHGCRFVHQDIGLIETSTVLDNPNFSKGFKTRFGTIRRATLLREAAFREARSSVARL